MALVRLENASLAFGEFPLLDEVNLSIEPGEHLFLIGRNGMGKSCLLKVIKGQLNLDHGKVHRTPGLKIAELSQDLTNLKDATVYDVVAEGLMEMGAILKRYHHLTHLLETAFEEKLLKDLEETQRQLESQDGWQMLQFIDTILTRLELPADQKLSSLSGGWQRRVALARALVSRPDLLLLDEPTNHLDLAAIEWLEEYLADFPGAVICITHDRTFLRKLSQKILELDRGQLTTFEGGFDKYLVDKQHELEVEQRNDRLFDKNLAKEEAWIRQGVKARRTRNEGRVRELKKLREERAKRVSLQGKPKFSANQAQQSGELVVNAENIGYHINQRYLVKDFSIRIIRGDKIALVGPNGIGKSTLLKLLLGQLTPQEGKIQLGTNLQIAYFDQLRAGIDLERSAIENVAGGRESILIEGKEKHIVSYLQDFLFTPQRMRIPVKLLSGGECNRLLLAKLFSLPNNLLVLDEPTNDLDIESLELLEDILMNYKGTVLLVSHDRTFVNSVATSTLFFAGEGRIVEYVGGYDAIPVAISNSASGKTNVQKTEKLGKTDNSIPSLAIATASLEAKDSIGKPVINFNSKMKKELEEMPEKIAKWEAEQQALQNEIAAPDFYNQDAAYVTETLAKLAKVDATLQKAFKRWEELEALKN